MIQFKDLKFVRKIQGGLTLIGIFATMVVVVGIVGLLRVSDAKDSIFEEYVLPKQQIDKIYSRFQGTQFIMLQLSMPAFVDKFGENMALFSNNSESIDISIDSLLNSDFSEEITIEIESVNEIWEEYKAVVADAIISASVTQNFDMAADIATTSGEEVGYKLLESFANINGILEVKSGQLNQKISNTVSSAIFWNLLSAILGTIAYILSAFFLAPAITKPINKLQKVVKEFASGNYKVELVADSKDEIGSLTESLITMQQAQQEKIKAAENIAAGSLQKVESSSERDDLAKAINKEVDEIEGLLEEANKLIKANEEGNLDLRGDTSKFEGGWRQLIEGINSILDAVVKPFNQSGKVLTAMASGDFTASFEGDYKGYYLQIQSNFNQLRESMQKVLGEVVTSTKAVMEASNEISSSSEEMAAGAQEQTQQASQVAVAVDEMTRTILENTKNASLMAGSAKEQGNKAKEGGSVVKETIGGMMKIAEVVEKSATTVKGLGESSNKIGEIIEVIDDIADQTNLLALNAAIEAARAGEQGRGFAVVADEVRKLAERTTKATKEIAMTINQIQKDTTDAVNSIEEGSIEVEKGKELASKASIVLEDIISGAENVSDVAVQVAAASEEQSNTAEGISRNIDAIASVTEQNAGGTQQIAKSSEELLRLTETLQGLMNAFKFTNDGKNFEVRKNGKIVSAKYIGDQ